MSAHSCALSSPPRRGLTEIQIQCIPTQFNKLRRSVLLPLASHKMWYRRVKSLVVPVPGNPASVMVAAVGGVLDLACSSGDIGVRFGKYCQDNLCLENWEFVLSALAYRQVKSSALFGIALCNGHMFCTRPVRRHLKILGTQACGSCRCST